MRVSMNRSMRVSTARAGAGGFLQSSQAVTCGIAKLPTSASFDHEAALVACAGGDTQAFREIYDHESRFLLGVAVRIVRQREAAEDVVHDAFVQIWQKAASFDARLGSGRGWIYTVVRHAALNHLRRSQREISTDDGVLEVLLDATVPVDDPGELDAGSLERCLGLLDEPRRRSIVHAYVDGYNHAQIAARMQAPLGTVKSWIRRGLLSLRECLS